MSQTIPTDYSWSGTCDQWGPLAWRSLRSRTRATTCTTCWGKGTDNYAVQIRYTKALTVERCYCRECETCISNQQGIDNWYEARRQSWPVTESPPTPQGWPVTKILTEA